MVVASGTDLAEVPALPGIAVELVVDDVVAAPSGVYSAHFALAEVDSAGSTLPVHVVVWVAPACWVAVAVIEVVAATRPSVAASAPSFASSRPVVSATAPAHHRVSSACLSYLVGNWFLYCHPAFPFSLIFWLDTVRGLHAR